MKRIFIAFIVVNLSFLFSAAAFSDDPPISVTNVNSPVISATYTGITEGAAIYGTANSPDGQVIGVYGYSAGFCGVLGEIPEGAGAEKAGVAGICDDEGSVGVAAINKNPNGYAIYAEGHEFVNGSLVISGAIYARENENLAFDADASASSEYNDNYSASKINDGFFDRWDYGEWASKGEKIGAWIQLDWDTPQDMNKILIRGRPNRFDQIHDAWLNVIHADGSRTNIRLGMFSSGGAPKTIYLTEGEGTDVVSIRVEITESSPSTLNTGLAEIECYYNPAIW